MKGIKKNNKSLAGMQTKLRGVFFVIYSMFICFSLKTYALADKLQSSTFFTGTKELLDDATKAVGILAPIVIIIVVVYFFMRKSAADEMDYKKWDTKIKTALICGVGIETAAILINLFISYYK